MPEIVNIDKYMEDIEAHKYAIENVKLNKLENVKLYLGDVKQVLPRIRKSFDRVLMPCPRTQKTIF